MLKDYIWYEKYRPKKLKQLNMPEEHRVAFKKFFKDEQIPHLLLNGPRGSGKTTLSNIIIDSIPCVAMRLNASGKDDRSIDTMQTKVKGFAASQPPKGKIKVIFCDEADGMLPASQESLQNIIETYSKSCRFILTCNHVDKIIPTIQSRCMRFDFGQFPKEDVVAMCLGICKKEKVKADGTDITELVDKFHPDVRSIVNNLQASCLGGLFDPKMVGALGADPAIICKLILQGKLFSIRKEIAGMTEFIYLYKYLFDVFVPANGNDEAKMGMALAVAESIADDPKVPDREINFVACLVMIMQALDINVSFIK